MRRGPWRRRFVLPWDDMWRAALRLGLSPQAFWKLSLREWRWLSSSFEASMDGSTLTEMMEAYPDGRV
ncbi:MAG: phage tail assembly chaperone [Pseudomonadota bacterium]